MKIELSELTMAYEDTGRGPPLLLLHGFPLGRRIWRPQLEALLASCRVIAPDLRGHGDSQSLPGSYAMETLAHDCLELLDALEVDEPVVVCGLSMGGYVAFALQALAPERVAGLVLAATRAGADTPAGRVARDELIVKARTQGVGTVVEAMLPKLFAPQSAKSKQAVIDYAKAAMLKTSLEGIVGALEGMKERPDVTPRLAALDVPTLILHGRDDQLIPLTEAEAMHRAIRGSRLQVLDAAGHLVNLEQPQAFNTAVRDFMRLVASPAQDEVRH